MLELEKCVADLVEEEEDEYVIMPEQLTCSSKNMR